MGCKEVFITESHGRVNMMRIMDSVYRFRQVPLGDLSSVELQTGIASFYASEILSDTVGCSCHNLIYYPSSEQIKTLS